MKTKTSNVTSLIRLNWVQKLKYPDVSHEKGALLDDGITFTTLLKMNNPYVDFLYQSTENTP